MFHHRARRHGQVTILLIRLQAAVRQVAAIAVVIAAVLWAVWLLWQAS